MTDFALDEGSPAYFDGEIVDPPRRRRVALPKVPKTARKKGVHAWRRHKIREGALPAPWIHPEWGPNAFLEAGLPAERSWEERRRATIADLRAELKLAYRAIGKGRAFPGKNMLRGPLLLAYARGIRLALKLWEPELAAGEPKTDAPTSDELPPGYWNPSLR